MAGDLQFLALNELADIERLINDGIEESLHLDYKASPSLARNSVEVNEMCKDVSAFANSAGGQIIYGVAEDRKTQKPAIGDPGVTDEKITREWLEQIIDSKIQPRISGVRITRIATKVGFVFVFTIPPSQTGPHQAPDKKYYKRFDLRSVPMEDYEIRDVMRRASTPNLLVKLTFARGDRQRLDFADRQQLSKPFPLVAWISNLSPQPAEFAIIDIGIDQDLSVPLNGAYDFIGTHDDPRGIRLGWYRFAVRPPRIPIFKEHEQRLGDGDKDLNLSFHSSLLQGEKIFDFAVKIAAPGFTDTSYWLGHSSDALLTLYPPGHYLVRTRIG